MPQRYFHTSYLCHYPAYLPSNRLPSMKLHLYRCDMLDNNCASTLIGQCLEVLNNEAQPIDEFNLENFPVGNLECNVEEVSG